MSWPDRLRRLLPVSLSVDTAERWRSILGALLGVLVTALVSRHLAEQTGVEPWLAAPLGASAVLLFALPSSPLAQPWPVIGGNTLSALVGVMCAGLIPDAALAAALAVGAALLVMFAMRCLHPPGGAIALLAVILQPIDLRFVLVPVLLNAVLIVTVAIGFNRMVGRRYPNRAAPSAPPSPSRSRFSSADLDAALAHYNRVLDVSREDLAALLNLAEAQAYRRSLGELRCRDIMSHGLVSVAQDTPVAEAWQLMRRREIKALPVVESSGRIAGIVTLADFVRKVYLPTDRLAAADAVRPQAPQVDAPVSAIMTRPVRCAALDQQVIELLPLFSEGGHHHLPILDEAGRPVGMVTQSDLVRALHRAVRPPDDAQARAHS
jgi:CBS domain-containing membrane protein